MKSLFAVWLGWTGLLGVGLLVVLFAKPALVAGAAILAVIASLAIGGACLRSWWAGAEYRWFWWWR
jgi:hypothetical protein